MDILCAGVRPFASPVPTELCFWLRALEEDAAMLCPELSDAGQGLARTAGEYRGAFQGLRQRLEGPEQEYQMLLLRAEETVGGFFLFIRDLLRLVQTCRLESPRLTPLLLDHISREAMYCLKMLSCSREKAVATSDVLIAETVFWLRAMSDHLTMLRSQLDPSERVVHEQVCQLSERYDIMNLRGRDFASRLWHQEPTNELIRFEKEVARAACEVKAFFAAFEVLVKECAVLSTLDACRAEHVRLEAEHFLHMMGIVRGALILAPCGLSADADPD